MLLSQSFFGSVHDRIGTEAQMYHLHKPCLRWKHDDVSLSETEIQIPGFYIDVPYEKNQDSISYVADQLRELKKFLEDVGGKKISEQSVQRAVANSNEAASYYSSQLALRKDHDPVTSLTNELYAIFMCHLLAGSEESLKYTKMLLEDVKKAPKGEGLHILWMHMMPFLPGAGKGCI